jgi:hypothetical protein
MSAVAMRELYHRTSATLAPLIQVKVPLCAGHGDAPASCGV